MWVPSPVSCPGGATPPPPVDDRSGDLVSGACTGALPRAHTPCTGRTRLVRPVPVQSLPRETGPSSGRHVVLWGRPPRGNGGRVAAVLLVDNAAQPMQAAPVAALKGIAVSGNASKLHVIFTHFDQVKGDNLPGFSDREQHVVVGDLAGASVGVAAAIGMHQRADVGARGAVRDRLPTAITISTCPSWTSLGCKHAVLDRPSCLGSTAQTSPSKSLRVTSRHRAP